MVQFHNSEYYFYSMVLLTEELRFPSTDYADEHGLLAIGGDLSVERLKLAYSSGIFPWYSEDQPILWFSPDPRMVLFPDELRVTKSMRQVLNSERFRVTFNEAFNEVISACKTIDRTGQGQYDTWITDDMKKAYIRLHEAGIAKSLEVWEGDELVGGLYGVEVGNIFCGESMFSKVSNASKVALIALVRSEHYQLIDCQIYSDHLASMGAREIPRETFLGYL
jgi:leucyl/phenylalanyl-tRNA--protein transferase